MRLTKSRAPKTNCHFAVADWNLMFFVARYRGAVSKLEIERKLLEKD
jgi:hypothetical protein